MATVFAFVPAVLLPALLAGSLLAVDAPAIGTDTAPPWTESFSMVLREQDRTFVTYEGISYLIMQATDLADPLFVDQKDVVVVAKLEHTDGPRAYFYGLPRFEALGRTEQWSTRLDGDNLYLFGRITAGRGATPTRLALAHLVTAPSDAQIIAKRLETIPVTDHQGRLGVAKWVRETGAKQGNRDFWLAMSENIVVQTIKDVAAQASEKKDGKQLLMALDWALELAKDTTLAATIGSQPWIQEGGGAIAEEISTRMRRLDFDFYNGQWRSRPEALSMEFEDRYAAIGWRDADAYYKLGRWAEAHAEILPRSREVSLRAYQAGYRADANHNGLRRELGMEQVSGDGGGKAIPTGAFLDTDTKVAADGPEGWKRAAPIDGDATWVDPQSDTAYISVKVVRDHDRTAGIDALWSSVKVPFATRNGFTVSADENIAFSNGQAKRLRYSYQEGPFLRLGEMVLLLTPNGAAPVLLNASFTEGEQEAGAKALAAMIPRVAIPAAGATGEAKPPASAAPPAAKPRP